MNGAKAMKRKSIVAVFLAAGMLIGGCAAQNPEKEQEDGNNSQQETVEENPYQAMLDVIQPSAYGDVQGLSISPGSVISVIGRGSSSAYWSAVQEGARQAVEDLNSLLGYKGEDQVSLTYSAPVTENDVDDQVNILDEELDRYPQALGIAAVDSSACEVQFDLAAENSIPIVAFDSGTNYQNIVCMIDTDNVEAAKTAATKLCSNIGDSGEVAVFVHDSKSTSAKERESGFLEEISQSHPNVSVVRVYHLDELEKIGEEMQAAEQSAQTGEAGEDAEETQEISVTQEEAIAYILDQHPEIRGCFTTSESVAEIVTDVLESREQEDVSVISFDGGEEQLERLQEEKLDGLIVQNPYGIGYATVVACVRAVGDQGNEAKVNTGYTWVTRDNVKEESISKMMY